MSQNSPVCATGSVNHRDMRRVSRPVCEEGPLLEEQETEGQRQLHQLLLQQLHTSVDLERCVAKRQCFAPATLYRPFGEQAAGVRSLSQFQALQDGESEQARLRELGLSDAEVQLWLTRDGPESSHKGVVAAPAARHERLQVIQDKMAARAELLALPQRFTGSRPLPRRQMEIEQALFHGTERPPFLSALYHHDVQSSTGQQGAVTSDPMDSVYWDVLHGEGRSRPPTAPPLPSTATASSDQSQRPQAHTGQSDAGPLGPLETQGDPGPRLAAPRPLRMSQPIGSMSGGMGAEQGRPFRLKGAVEDIPDEEILCNRESEDGIRKLPRFQNYHAGEPSKVLCVKNLSPQAAPAQLVALFSRFDTAGGPPVGYRLLTGRLRGHAFITLPDSETAQKALQLVHGYRLLGKPLVIEFGREKTEATQTTACTAAT